MTTIDTLSHWRLERDADGLAWLTFDRAGSAVNALSADTLAEFAVVLDALDAAPPKGLIIRSGKATGFIVGADVNESAGPTRPEQVCARWSRAAAESLQSASARAALSHAGAGRGPLPGRRAGAGARLPLPPGGGPARHLASPCPEVMLGISRLGQWARCACRG